VRNQSLDNQGNGGGRRTSDFGPRPSDCRRQTVTADSDLDSEEPSSDVRLTNHNRDDAGAGLSWSEVGSDALLHGEPAALIATKTNGGRGTVLEKSDKRDLHRRSIVTDDRTELHNADHTTDAGRAWVNRTTDKDISAAGESDDPADRQQEREEALHGLPSGQT
jgi:hypothetical protein